MKQFYTTDDKELAHDISAYVNHTFQIFRRWPTHVEEDSNKLFKYAVVVDKEYEEDVWYYSTTVKQVQDSMVDFKAGYYWRKNNYERNTPNNGR